MSYFLLLSATIGLASFTLSTTGPLLQQILIVDDEPPARRRLIPMLSRIPDVKVVGGAQDGIEALEFIRTTPPDLILLDIRMPRMGDSKGRSTCWMKPCPSLKSGFATKGSCECIARSW